jgi:hypothetical protein
MMGYNRLTVGEYEERSWVISIASKSSAKKATIGGIDIERGATEAQPEAIESLSKGATKAAIGK